MLYRMAAAATLTGVFQWSDAALVFAELTVGGVALGALAGVAANAAFARLRDTPLVILITFLVAWAAYIGAETLHVSGVLSVVTAGLIMGWRQHAILDAQSRLEAQAVWRTVVFAMEALVFILIGLALRKIIEDLGGFGPALDSALPTALLVTLAVIVSRFTWVLPATYLPRLLIPAVRRRDPSPPLAVPLLIGWAGMRGVVSLAAALALPIGFPGRSFIIFATFVVIAVTVLFQGVSLGLLVRWLKPPAHPARVRAHLSDHQARAQIYEASVALLAGLVDDKGEPLHPKLLEDYQRRVYVYRRNHEDAEGVAGMRKAHFDTALAALAAARETLLRLHRAGDIHDTTLHALELELDLEEARLRRLSGVSLTH
jgi:CPA1 family monovalent cation:H+ antiporter